MLLVQGTTAGYNTATGGRADTLHDGYHTLVSGESYCLLVTLPAGTKARMLLPPVRKRPPGKRLRPQRSMRTLRPFPEVLSPSKPFSENYLSQFSGSSLTAKLSFLWPDTWMLSSG